MTFLFFKMLLSLSPVFGKYEYLLAQCVATTLYLLRKQWQIDCSILFHFSSCVRMCLRLKSSTKATLPLLHNLGWAKFAKSNTNSKCYPWDFQFDHIVSKVQQIDNLKLKGCFYMHCIWPKKSCGMYLFWIFNIW